MKTLFSQLRLSYLPPLMVYLAAGIQGLTGIVGTFYVKERLGLSAEFLASLAFWAGLPFTIKMPIGHIVDLMWRWKAWLVYLGAVLVAVSLLIMMGLISEPSAMAARWPLANWFVLSALLGPVGYVLQDVVADAMTVEAVPLLNVRGEPFSAEALQSMHTTMQTLGRVAVVGGSLLVALLNVWVFAGTSQLTTIQKTQMYSSVYMWALVIPLISVLGVSLDGIFRRLRPPAHGLARAQGAASSLAQPNWTILGGSFVFVLFSIGMGLSEWRWAQELIFIGSLAIVLFLIRNLTADLAVDARRTLLGTALVIFMFRAVPSAGDGVQWWTMDVLGFDPQFFSHLALVGSVLTLVGMFAARRWMAERSIQSVVLWLTGLGFVLSLPTLGMSLGLHHWTAQATGGLVDARFIALVDTALESPLGQIAMIPMLAWIASSAPEHLKATYFAVMASFTNLALSASQLGTKYLNQLFVLTREVRDPVTNAVTVFANYIDLTALLACTVALGLLLPLLGIAFVRYASPAPKLGNGIT
jgi:BT1 family